MGKTLGFAKAENVVVQKKQANEHIPCIARKLKWFCSVERTIVFHRIYISIIGSELNPLLSSMLSNKFPFCFSLLLAF